MKVQGPWFRALGAVVGLMLAGVAFGTPTVKIDKAQQRWPWNGKMDVGYTLSGLQLQSTNRYDLTLIFKAGDKSVTNNLTGTAVDAGAHTFVFDGVEAFGNLAKSRIEVAAELNEAILPDTSQVVFKDKSVDYDGSAQSIDYLELPEGVTATVAYTKDGTVVANPTDVGIYTATLTFAVTNPRDYLVPSPKTATLTINKKSVTAPTAMTGLFYNGSVQTGVDDIPSATYATLTSGQTSATAAGNYSATYTLTSTTNYKWSDNTTTAAKKVDWSIAAKSITPTVSLSKTSAYTTDSGWNTLPSVTVKDGTTTLTAGTDYTTSSWSPSSVSDAGTYTVTVTLKGNYSGSKTATYVVEDSVQLWENGPRWAFCNVGATKPEEFGYYFWWGDTVGYKRNGSSWDAADGSRTGFSFDSANCPTYGKNASQLMSEGFIDTLDGNLNLAHDAAQAHLGGSWRMPTKAEFDALVSNCTTEWTTRNGVYGRLFKGKAIGYTDKSIFLPAAGYGNWSSLEYSGSYCDYWSSTPTWYVYFNSSGYYSNKYWKYCCYGRSVRPVRGLAE